MASEDRGSEGRDSEGRDFDDRDSEHQPGSREGGASGFGPPVSDFGPPVGDFGPPVGDFGPPVSEFGAPPNDFGPPRGAAPHVGWSPVDDPERPNLGWQPADGPPEPPAPPPPEADIPPGDERTEIVRDVPRFQPPGPQPPGPPAGPPTPPPMRPPQQRAEMPDQGGSDPNAPGPPRAARSLWDDDELAKQVFAPRPEPQRESSSLWDDEPGDTSEPSRPEPDRPRRNTGVLIGGLIATLVVVVAIAAVIVVFATRGGGGGGGGGPEDATGPAVSPNTAVGCPNRTDGRVTIGNGPGGTDTGPGAILGMQHAFYVDRDAAKARTFVASGTVGIAQEAIDQQVPMGTSYCLRIEEVAPNVYNVDVNEYRPDGGAPQYLQQVSVGNRDNKYLITSIVTR